MKSHTPGLNTLIHYQRPWLRGDLVAGVTVAAYLVPQVMAYAEVAGLPAVVGLWAMLGPIVAYAVLGSSPQLSVGPESTTALMTAVTLAPMADGDPSRYAALAALLAGLVGLICVVGWIARAGVLADLISKPVLVGYMAGIAVLMIISQLGKVTRLDIDDSSSLIAVRSLVTQLTEIHLPTLLLAAATLVVFIVGGRLFPRLPMPLIGIVLASLAVWAFSLQDHGIEVIGDVPLGLPTPTLPSVTMSDVADLILPAAGIAIVGYSDTILTARALAARNRTVVDSNQELLALGAANLLTAVTRGFPVSSSASRSFLGVAVGSRSQLYSLVALVVVVVILLIGGPALATFPSAALGALVIYAALRLVDLAEFRRLARFRRSEIVLAVATTVAVLALDVLYGVLVAIALSILDLLRRVARPHDGILGYVPGLAGMHDVDDYASARQVPGLVVYRYDAPLFFANAEDFRRRALAAIDQAPGPVEWFILNTEANVEVDLTAVDSLDELRQELDEKGIVFALARVKQELLANLRSAGLADRFGADRIFPTLPTAVHAYVTWYSERHGGPPPGISIPPPPELT